MVRLVCALLVSAACLQVGRALAPHAPGARFWPAWQGGDAGRDTQVRGEMVMSHTLDCMIDSAQSSHYDGSNSGDSVKATCPGQEGLSPGGVTDTRRKGHE